MYFFYFNGSGSGDWVNFQLYEVKGPHKDTNRKRTLKVEAIDLESAEQKALLNGLKSITSIEVIPHQRPTDRQIEYATGVGIEVLDEYTDWDVSALLSRYEMRDSDPNEGLIEYATNKGIFFSLHIGKTALYQKVFAQLDDTDRVAFFIYCIYRYISDDRHANLDTHPRKDIFYQFAEQQVNNDKFIKSMNRYDGESIKFFGEYTVYGTTHFGGSVDTIAFKTAREYLVANELISASARYRSKTHYHTSTMTVRMTEEELKDAEMLGIKVLEVREVDTPEKQGFFTNVLFKLKNMFHR